MTTAQKIKSKELKSNKRLLKLLIDYYEKSQDNFYQARRGHTPDWGPVEKISVKIEDDFDLDVVKENL